MSYRERERDHSSSRTPVALMLAGNVFDFRFLFYVGFGTFFILSTALYLFYRGMKKKQTRGGANA